MLLQIRRTWEHMHREQFIHRAILDAQECRKGFYHKDSIKTDVSYIHQLCPVLSFVSMIIKYSMLCVAF